jgi:hypothetical protein
MFGKSAFFALACLVAVTTPVASFAQDAGVSGIPKGPGSAGGLNNSVNDPSGISNAARTPAPPAAEHGGARGAFDANGLRPSVGEIGAGRKPADRVLAPRSSSFIFAWRDPSPGQVDRSKDEHLQGLLAAVL